MKITLKTKICERCEGSEASINSMNIKKVIYQGIDGDLINNDNEEKYTHPQKPSQHWN
ncbi:MAG TPA: hypothetical protein VEH06_05260 [Candidatus Bathyarchaeia archaeon]|nr:hypothetical protein [Candidatus Bathyarchaeia archaeon]